MNWAIKLLLFKGLNMYKLFVVYFLALIIVGCGGGGTDSNVSIPATGSDSWSPEEPNYVGKREVFEVAPNEASETVLSVVESLDFLNMLAFGNDYSELYFLSENRTAIIDDSVTCTTGNVSTNESDTQVEAVYDKCQIDGSEITGTVKAFVDGSEVIVIPNLSLLDITLNELSTISGYFVLSNPSFATFNLLLDTGQESLFFDDFTLSFNYQNSVWNGDFSGDIYLSSQGKLSISPTTDENSEEKDSISFALNVSGDVDMYVVANLQESLVYTYSAEYIPVTLPLNVTIDNFDDLINESPSAVISPEILTSNRNTPFVLTAYASTDPDYDPLQASWELISGPTGGDITVNSDSTAIFNAHLPGEYVISLNVEDVAGNKSKIERTIKVLKNTPSLELSLTNEKNYIGHEFAAHTTILNDEFDGPYTYKIQYGPANMSVDSTGYIIWDSVIPNFGFDVDINFGLYVENSDKAWLEEKTLTFTPEQAPTIEKVAGTQSVSFPMSSYTNSAFVAESSSIPKLFNGGNKLTQLTYNSGQITLENTVLITNKRNAQYQDVYDANNDGVDDYWFSGIEVDNDESESTHIYWKDGKTFEEHSFMQLDDSYGRTLKFKLIDLDQDNQPEIFVSSSVWGYDTQVYDFVTSEVLYELDKFSFDFSRACDFNGDGFVDFSYGSRVVDIINNSDIYNQSNVRIYPIDTDGDNICDLVESSVYEMTTNIIRTSLDNQSIALIDNQILDRNFIIGNFVGDAGEEVVIQYYVNGQSSSTEAVVLFKIDDQFQISSETIAREIAATYQDPLNDVAIYDVDGDGYDEIIRRSDAEGGGVQYIVTKLEELQFNKIAETETLTTTEPQLIDWKNDGQLTYIGGNLPSSLISLTPELGAEILFQDNNLYDAILQDDQYFVFLKSTSHSLTKLDLSHTQLWQDDISTDYNFDAQIFDEYALVQGTSGSDYLINSNSGEQLYSIPSINTNTHRKYDFSANSNLPKFIASRRSNSLLRINENLSVDVLYDENIGSLMDEADDYTFMQADKDEQLELVIYTHTHLSREFKLLDTATLEIEILSENPEGLIEGLDIQDDELLTCFSWDTDCQNLVYLTNSKLDVQDIYNSPNQGSNKAIKVVDKLTGKLIWQSPDLLVNDILFKRTSNKIATALSIEDNTIYTIK